MSETNDPEDSTVKTVAKTPEKKVHVTRSSSAKKEQFHDEEAKDVVNAKSPLQVTPGVGKTIGGRLESKYGLKTLGDLRNFVFDDPDAAEKLRKCVADNQGWRVKAIVADIQEQVTERLAALVKELESLEVKGGEEPDPKKKLFDE